ncbi:MAG: ABC transporter permease, partial [Acidimicrobiia bacterium]
MAAPPVTDPEVAAPVTPKLEEASKRAEARRGFLIALPSFVYLILLFVVPLVLVFVYSFATRDSTGLTVLEDWNLESYKRLFSSEVLEIFLRSLVLALMTTVICLVICYPFAFYIATRTPRVRNVLLILVMIPFWSNFLVRTYAWRILLGSEGPLSQLSVLFGGEPF